MKPVTAHLIGVAPLLLIVLSGMGIIIYHAFVSRDPLSIFIIFAVAAFLWAKYWQDRGDKLAASEGSRRKRTI